MLENIKINSNDQAEIVDLYAWMDGGTVNIKLETIDHSEIEIEFVQKVNLKISEHNPYPGRLLLNKIIVGLRSDLEKKIISVLKNAVFPKKISLNDKKMTDDCIHFVESEEYVLLVKNSEQKQIDHSE